MIRLGSKPKLKMINRPTLTKKEIIDSKSLNQMKKELSHASYMNFKDDTRMWMRHLDIVKKEHKDSYFDSMSPNGESMLFIYIEAWLNSMTDEEIKDFYVDRVMKGEISYHE